MKITNKEKRRRLKVCHDWLDKVAYKRVADYSKICPSDDTNVYVEYRSKYDDSYITLECMGSDVYYLASRGITENLQHGVGFSPKDNMWYGWSHRAIYGFTIGSEVKRGDCAYNPRDKEDFIQYMLDFWSDDEYHKWTKVKEDSITEDGFWIEYLYDDTVPNEKIRNTIDSIHNEFPKKYGNGAWVAKNLKDAQQMAIDFNEGVS